MDERERWLFGGGVILAIALVLFLLFAILNAGTLLVGWALLVVQVALVVIVGAVAVAAWWWLIGSILSRIAASEHRLRAELEALRKTLLRLTNNFGADFLALVTGLLTLLIQEAVTDYPRVYRVSIAVLFTIVFFLAAQLIGSDDRKSRVLGIFFFIAPLATFLAGLLPFVSPDEVRTWFRTRPAGELASCSGCC